VSLPFSHEAFLDVFGAYNRALWPAVVVLWGATVVVFVQLLRRGAAASRLLATLLAVHWAWSGAVYHLVYFRPLNPPATLFGILFLAEAGLLVWRGLVRRDLVVEPSWSTRGLVGGALIVYGLVYPALGLLFGLQVPRLPLFAVPCPTTLLTAGVLLLVRRRQAWPLAVVPVVWSGVGGSAAFLLGIRADFALLVAGLALAVHCVVPARSAPAATRNLRATG
jgi:hypothetical protein